MQDPAASASAKSDEPTATTSLPALDGALDMPGSSAASADDDEPPDEWMEYAATPDGWRALGVSVRGFDHEDVNTHRDDAAALAVVGSWLICAVADGVGSAKMSRFGARAAANAAVAKIAENMRLLALPADTGQLTSVMNVGMMAALNAMQGLAQQRKRRLSDFSTTLLLLIHGHDAQGTQLVVTAQVGDGAIAAFAPGNPADEGSPALTFVQLGTPDEGYSGGEIIPFNRLQPALWPKRILVRHLPPETVGIMLLTDGVSDAFKPWYRHMWRLMKFLGEHVTPVSSAGEALAQLRATMSFDQPGMGDDRTIIVVHRPA
jgi:hypothetical protein